MIPTPLNNHPVYNSEFLISQPSVEEALEVLNRSIRFSQGEFSIILAHCDNLYLRRLLVDKLTASSPCTIQELTLHPRVEKLFDTLEAASGNPQADAIMVMGLESVIGLENLLSHTNLVRNEFPKAFNFPLVLWVNDDILRHLRRLSPDLNSWASTPIRFD